jgi:hypothetical protein
MQINARHSQLKQVKQDRCKLFEKISFDIFLKKYFFKLSLPNKFKKDLLFAKISSQRENEKLIIESLLFCVDLLNY